MRLKGRSFINTLEFSAKELEGLLAKAAAIKKAKKDAQPLKGKSVALVFFNPSLRTRVSFQVGIAQLGGQAVSMSVGSESWTLEHHDGAVMNADKTEHIKDAAGASLGTVSVVALKNGGSLLPPPATPPSRLVPQACVGENAFAPLAGTPSVHSISDSSTGTTVHSALPCSRLSLHGDWMGVPVVKL